MNYYQLIMHFVQIISEIKLQMMEINKLNELVNGDRYTKLI